ncbi:MAG TPA: corrinoid protein [Armatimonadota bacterium]|jgi:5-methyltetrahydrofolate--homocysteine methyltransferase
MAVDLQALADNIIKGKKNPAVELTKQAIDEGVHPQNIITDGLIAGMAVVGEKFKKNEFYVPEVLIAARAMKECMALLKPLLAENDVQPVGTVVIGTVKGDLHDIGKNLVSMMLQGNGFDVIDLGVDVTPEKFIDAAKEHKANLIALSALLTTTMPAMQQTVAALEAAGARSSFKVMIGGAPVTQKFSDEIGADGYSPDAASAVDLAKTLMGIVA